jgi:hypothetical protein
LSAVQRFPHVGFFPNSAGVANVLDFGADLPAPPAYVANGRNADGFAEHADIAAKGQEWTTAG